MPSLDQHPLITLTPALRRLLDPDYRARVLAMFNETPVQVFNAAVQNFAATIEASLDGRGSLPPGSGEAA